MLLCSLWSLLSAVRNLHLRKARRPDSVLPVSPNGDDSLCPWMLEAAQLPKGEVTCHILAQKLPCCSRCFRALPAILEMPWLIKGDHLSYTSWSLPHFCSWNDYLSSRREQRSCFRNAFPSFDWYLTTRGLVTLLDPASLYLQSKNSTWQKNT